MPNKHAERQSDEIVIRFSGDSGDGVQLVGEQLTITAALTGRDVRTLPDFPAEIRAPAGTVAGVSGFQLAMSEHAIFTAGEHLDVLVALNPAALKKSLEYLDQGGLIILNEDSMQLKDWEKAGCDPELLTDIQARFQVIIVPLITQTLKALEGLNLTHAQSKKSKNFYVLGIVLWLFDLTTDYCLHFIQKKFKNKTSLLEANQKALLAGYNYAMTLELSRHDYQMGQIQRESGEYRQITGVEAVAMAVATLTASTQVPMFVSGYPITPSSAILQACVQLKDFGVELFQAEDEIAAICSCIGASFGGRLAMTCTSGPGLDLKSESLGLAVVAELPLVLIDVMRAGASTGLPTKTGQSDLFQALYGRHGEAPLPVLAAQSPSDCFETILDAFRIAIRAMTPVIVLLDAYLATAAEPWKIPELNTLQLPNIEFNRFPKPYQRDNEGNRSWNTPGTPGFIHQLGGLEKSGEDGAVSYDANNHQHMVNTRAKKMDSIASHYPKLNVEGHLASNTLVIGWGSTYGSIRSAIEDLPVAFLHLRYLNPLPNDLGEILARYNTILVAELNSGQLCQLIRAKYLVDAKSIHQCTGQPFTSTFLKQAIHHALEAEALHG